MKVVAETRTTVIYYVPPWESFNENFWSFTIIATLTKVKNKLRLKNPEQHFFPL